MRQCTILTPKSDISFKVSGKGRVITLKAGTSLWVSNCEPDQTARGVITVAKKTHCIGQCYDFTPAQVAELFTVTASPLTHNRGVRR